MAAPVHNLWDEEVPGSGDLWSLDFGDSRLFDSMPVTDLSPDDTKAADTPRESTEHRLPSQSADPLLQSFSAVQSFEIRDDENAWLNRLILSPSAPTTVRLETSLSNRDVGQDTAMSLKERVKAMAQTDPRHVSQQEKRRDAFIEIRLQQLGAENVGAVGSVAPEWRSGAETDTASQKCPHYEARNSKGNGEFLQWTGPVICPSAVNTEFDEASIGMSSELSPFISSSSSGIASGSSMLGSSKHENAEGDTERQHREQSLQALAGNQSSRNSTFTEMVWTQDMSPASQKPKQTRTNEERATRLAVRRRGGACPKHKSNRKACRCRLSGYGSERFRTPSSCAPLIEPDSTSRHPPPALETTLSEDRAPRQIVSQYLLIFVKCNDFIINEMASFLHEDLPGILRAAAGLLETDAELSTAMWLPVLRAVCTIFRSAETLIRDVEISAITIGFRKRFYHDLFQMLSLIFNILSEDCPTPLKIMRFLEYLMEAINDLKHQLSLAGVTEDTEPTKVNTLKLWLDTTQSELHTVRSLLPEDTPVFTCPFPLAGCTYQTTNMQQWILHKNQCYKWRSARRKARPTENEANERLDSREAIRTSPRMATPRLQLSWVSNAPTRGTLRGTAHSITTSIFYSAESGFLGRSSQRGCTEVRLPPRSPPEYNHPLLFKLIYRIVWLGLLRLFGLCMLSVMPLCTNVLGFVLCWLKILRSVSMWKCKGV